jgi:hypothetical protein
MSQGIGYRAPPWIIVEMAKPSCYLGVRQFILLLVFIRFSDIDEE